MSLINDGIIYAETLVYHDHEQSKICPVRIMDILSTGSQSGKSNYLYCRQSTLAVNNITKKEFKDALKKECPWMYEVPGTDCLVNLREIDWAKMPVVYSVMRSWERKELLSVHFRNRTEKQDREDADRLRFDEHKMLALYDAANIYLGKTAAVAHPGFRERGGPIGEDIYILEFAAGSQNSGIQWNALGLYAKDSMQQYLNEEVVYHQILEPNPGVFRLCMFYSDNRKMYVPGFINSKMISLDRNDHPICHLERKAFLASGDNMPEHAAADECFRDFFLKDFGSGGKRSFLASFFFNQKELDRARDQDQLIREDAIGAYSRTDGLEFLMSRTGIPVPYPGALDRLRGLFGDRIINTGRMLLNADAVLWKLCITEDNRFYSENGKAKIVLPSGGSNFGVREYWINESEFVRVAELMFPEKAGKLSSNKEILIESENKISLLKPEGVLIAREPSHVKSSRMELFAYDGTVLKVVSPEFFAKHVEYAGKNCFVRIRGWSDFRINLNLLDPDNPVEMIPSRMSIDGIALLNIVYEGNRLVLRHPSLANEDADMIIQEVKKRKH